MAHRVVLVAFDGMQLLDLAGPTDVLRAATLLGADPGYELITATLDGEAARADSGITVVPDTSLAALRRRRGPIDAQARRAAMSPRSFARAFRAETGTTPASHVESLRVEAARRMLESTDLTVGAVAHRVGLRHPEILHRAFRRRVATTPQSYRDHFTTTSRSA